MSDIVKILPYSIDLNETIKKTELHTLFVMGDNLAHRFELTITNGSEAVDLTDATVTGYFTNFKEKTTITVTGKAEDDKALITLNKPCYTLHGQFVLIIQVKIGDVEASVFQGEGFMRTSKAEKIVYDDYVVYDINTLLAQISAMKTATENANKAAAAADAAAEHAPYINDGNKHWMAWDTKTGAYVDTGVTATGQKGDAGDAGSTPYIGSNGNWWIGSTDTGTKAQGPAGQNGTGSGTVTAVTVSGTKYEPDQTGNVNLGELGGGEGTVTSVNGEAPDENGNVKLDAQKVGARPSTWTPSASDVGALPSDGTAADSVKLGGKAPEYYIQPRNLLDNSYFVDPINQRGQTSYTGICYSIDRWYGTPSSTTVNSGYVSIVKGTSDYALWVQYCPQIIAGKQYTLAIKKTNGEIAVLPFTAATDMGEVKTTFTTETEEITARYSSGKSMYYVGISNVGDTTISIEWAALYEGEYTADNLPPYVPKGYAAELAECMFYDQEFVARQAYSPFGWAFALNDTSARLVLPLLAPMRKDIAPSINLSGTLSLNGYGTSGEVSGATIDQYSDNAIRINLTSSGLTAGSFYELRANASTNARISISKDL